MGRKKALKRSYKCRDNLENVNMSSEEESQGTGVRLVSMPDLPIKVQRRIIKRNGKDGQSNNVAKPIYFKREIQLSRLYKKELSAPYIEQVFTSLKKIGQGSFGDVYEGISIENKRKYAIKVTNDNHSLLNYGEVRRLENIPEHCRCVNYYGAWEESYRVYIQMELCTTSLDKVIKLDNSLKEPQIWDVFVDIAQGLQHLHNHKMIHLDVKPSNIMVDPLTSKKFRTGLSVSEGDGRYVAPEVLCDGIYTYFGDVYSFGLMMLEIASNTSLPSRGKEWENIRNEILPDSYLKQELSDDFRLSIEGMIRRDHTKRPSMDDILITNKAQSVIAQHENGIRNNFVADWDSRWQSYLSHSSTFVGNNIDEQINESPLRQLQHSLTNIQPWNRVPLSSNCRAIEPTIPKHIHKKVVRE